MNSSIFKCQITHFRNEKLKRLFRYNYFMFYIDLDEIELVEKKIFLFSYNRTNIYNLRDKDYFVFDKPGIRKNIIKYLSDQNINTEGIKIRLLTNVSTFGYNFNPVSFYYIFDKNENPLCVVPEVGNTFHELKLFFLDITKLKETTFYDRQVKNFYVSPFLDHNNIFEFRLKIPDEKLLICINDYKEKKKVFSATLKGEKSELTNFNLFKMTLLFPLVTFKIIWLIHWQALKLVIKKIKFFRKTEHQDKQKGMVLKWEKR